MLSLTIKFRSLGSFINGENKKQQPVSKGGVIMYVLKIASNEPKFFLDIANNNVTLFYKFIFIPLAGTIRHGIIFECPSEETVEELKKVIQKAIDAKNKKSNFIQESLDKSEVVISGNATDGLREE